AGHAFVSLGTSGVLFAANASYLPNPESAVHTFCHALPNTWHQMGVILSATDSLNWLSEITGKGAGDLTGELIAATGADPLAVCTAPATDATIEPDAALGGAYADAYQRYRALYPAIRAVTA
ncbi:MAG: xylulokinase, partial [Mesorhizobium sp.]